MVKITIQLGEEEYQEFIKKVGRKTPKEAILNALGIKYTYNNDEKSAQITWKQMKKARDETERRYYELLQASLASKDGIAEENKYWHHIRE
jgi:hypothetical protein